MHLVLKFCLLLIGIQIGLGFEISPLILIGNFGVFDVLLLLCVIITSKYHINKNRIIIFSSILLLSFFMAIGNAYAVISPVVDGSILPVARMMWYAMWVYVIFVSGKEQISFLLLGISLGVIFYAGFSIVLYLQNPVMYFGIPYISSNVNNANTLGYFMSFGLVVMLLTLLEFPNCKIIKLIIYLGIVLCSTVGVMTMSKTFWLSFVIIAMISTLNKHRMFRYPIFLLFATLVYYIYPVLVSRLRGSKNSNNHRLDMLDAGVNMIDRSPFLGSGHQAFYKLGPLFNRIESDVHNVFIGVTIEYGIITLLIFCSIYFFLPITHLVKNFSIFDQKKMLFLLTIILGVLWGMVSGLVFSDRLYLVVITMCMTPAFHTKKFRIN